MESQPVWILNDRLFNELVIDRKMSLKYKRALIELWNRYGFDFIVRSFVNGNKWVMGRNTAYYYARSLGLKWYPTRHCWVKEY